MEISVSKSKKNTNVNYVFLTSTTQMFSKSNEYALYRS